MGLFDRLGNLGKGMVSIMKKGDAPASDRMAALERELAELKRGPSLTREQRKEVDDSERTLRQLKDLHAKGLLTDEEYAAKLASLAGASLPDPKEHLERHRSESSWDPPKGPSDEPADPDDDGPRIKKTL